MQVRQDLKNAQGELRTGQEVSVILRNKKQVLANWLAGWLASQQADRLASRQAGSPYQSS